MGKMKVLHPCWVEIDLSAVLANLRTTKRIIGRKVRLCYVVKANCYGYGLEEIVSACKEEPAIHMFGVASVSEGRKLRELGVKKPIIVFRNPFSWEIEEYGKYDLILTLSDFETLKYIEKNKIRMKAHIKLDTGLGRIGFLPEHLALLRTQLRKTSSVEIEGIYSHFATSYAKNKEAVEKQLALFLSEVQYLEEGIGEIGLKHIASSNAAISYPDSRLDMVRVGGAIYNQTDKRFAGVFSFKAKANFVKRVRRGAKMGYGWSYEARKDETIVTLPVGHGDGLIPFLGNEVGEVLVRGERCPIVGRIFMDCAMVSLRKDLRVSKGDEAVIIGKQGKEEIKLREIFEKLGHWNIIGNCLGDRVPRVYFCRGRIKKIINKGEN